MKLDRRRFHVAVMSGLWTVIGAALAAPAVAYLFSPPRSKKEPEWIDVGDISRLPLNQPEEVVFRRNRIDGWKVTSEKNTAWVVKKSESEVFALAPQCTHLGCAYHYEQKSNHFVCPCHTSAFTIEGTVLMGPAPRPLDRYEIRVQNNHLLLGGVQKVS